MDKYLDSLLKIMNKKMDGKKQVWLSERTGLQKSAVSRYLSGESELPFEAACKLATALDISLDDLIGRSVLPKDTLTSKIGELTMEVDRLKALLSQQDAKPSESEKGPDYREKASQALKVAKQAQKQEGPSLKPSLKHKSKP